MNQQPTLERSVRVFISSTFRDMQTERDILVRRIFPALRARMRLRGVELLDIDLRWGITEEQSERGETLAICLQEIDRCRPYFIGILGERYGSLTPPGAVTPELKQAYPVLSDAVGRSLTEVEILHGVLRDPSRAQAIFFERDPAWVEQLPPESRAHFVEAGDKRAKLSELKKRIRKSGATIVPYAQPEDLGHKLQRALEAMLDAKFPEPQAPDAFTLSARMHVAFARERRALYVGGETHLASLDAWAKRSGAPPLLVTGASGSGKSALVANWCARRTSDLVFEHYLGASPDGAEEYRVIRRLWEWLRRISDERIPAPSDTNALIESLGDRFSQAAAHAARNRQIIIIALDGLEKFAGDAPLRWLPTSLPPNIRLLASSLHASAELNSRGWDTLDVKPLAGAQRLDFVRRSLTRMRKGLSTDRTARIVGHALSSSPLFLKTLLQELRVAATNDQLDRRINTYLAARTLPELFDQFLERQEQDCGREVTRMICSMIWASREGLEEAEIMAIAKITPSAWAALHNGLGETVRDQDGRLAFDHDYIRQACARRYLDSPDAKRAAHIALANHMETLPASPRRAEELPFQYLEASEWPRLERLLSDISQFDFLHARGDVDLLHHWLALKAQGCDIELTLTRAVATQLPAPTQWRDEDIYCVGRICDFLEFAGARGDALLRLRQQLIDTLTRARGPDFFDTLRAQASFGQLLFKRGDYRQSRQVLERALAAQLRTRGEHEADALVTMVHLGDALLALGDYAGAKGVQEEAVAGLTRLHGAAHPDTLGAALNLGECYRAVGEFRRAKKLQQQVLQERSRTLGADHPDTLIAMHNLAGTMADEGDRAGAISVQERAVSTRTHILGPDSPATLASMHNLATMLRDQGDLVRARDLLQQVVAGHARSLGPAHPHTIQVRTTLSDTLFLIGDLEAARANAEQNVSELTRTAGADQTATLSAISNLCDVLRALADYSGARDRMQRVVELSTTQLGGEHPDTLAHLTSLGTLLVECGDAAGGFRVLKQVVEVREHTLGPDHASTLSAWSNVALAHMRLGDLEGAVKIEKRLLDTSVRTRGREHRDTLNRMNTLAASLERLGDANQACRLLEEVLETRTRNLGSNHVDTLRATNDLGTALSSAGDNARARKMYERAVQGYTHVLGEAHRNTLDSMNNLATVLFHLGDLAGAKRLTERVLTGRTRVLGATHPDTNLTRKNLEVITNRLSGR